MACIARLKQKDTSIAAVLESDPCVDEFESTPPVGTDLMKVIDGSVSWTAEWDETEISFYGGVFGTGRSGYANARMTVTFDIIASGTGAAGAAGVPYNMLFGASKYVESGLAAGAATYTLNTAIEAPCTIWLEKAGWLYKMYGCRGSMASMNEYLGFRIFRCNFQGQADISTWLAGTLPPPDFTAWEPQVLLTQANIVTSTIHGISVPIRTYTINTNNEISQVSDSGGQLIDITDWAPRADIVMAVDLTNNWPLIANSDATGAAEFASGLAAGNVLSTTMPDVQVRAPADQDVSGYRYWGAQLRINNETTPDGDVVHSFS